MVVQSYHKIAADLTGASSLAPGDDEGAIKLVKSLLEQWDERWLLVFDNYDEPKKFKFPGVTGFIPSSNNSSPKYVPDSVDLVTRWTW